MSNIGFIGLGNMGLPMAKNLVNAGHKVKAFDVLETVLTAATKAGIEIKSSTSEVVTDVEFIITMLPSGSIVLSVFEEITIVADKGTTIIDCSTVDVSSALKAHEMANDAGLNCLDSPVSGGITGAEAGTLTLMIGGDLDVFEKARPILEVVGGRLVHCGKEGAGQSAKICNNMLLGVTMIGLCEAFVLAEKLGLEQQALFDVVSTSSGSCWSLNNYCPVPDVGVISPADNDYKPGFSAALMLKDLKLSQQAADEVSSATPMGQKATEFYQNFSHEGYSQMDFSAVINQLREMKRA